jgi:hypothetical protein
MNIAWGQTTGNIIIGGSTQTGSITLGRSSTNYTVNVGSGSIAGSRTRVVNIGTNTTSISTTSQIQINIGPTTSYGIATFPANTTVAIANTSGSALSVTGNITGGNVTTTGKFYGTATNAQYADLAEIYAPDSDDIAPGDVVVFGGTAEISLTSVSHDPRVAGVVSTLPGVLMNDGADGIAVALTGRTPCRVKGPINKGDAVVSSHMSGVAQRLDPGSYVPCCVIGKSLDDITDDSVQVIEVVVGRF